MDISSATQDDADSRDCRSTSPAASDDQDLDLDQDQDREQDLGDHTMSIGDLQSGAASGSAKSNSKDPNRPRRKKARRACFACQRAHLTCGDERPCQRCIKRGLADQCQDGVRKKAKYLHDAPNEALLPGAATNYTHGELKRNGSTTSHPPDTPSQAPSFFQNAQSFPQLFTTTPTHTMPPPMLHERAPSFGQSQSYGSTMSQPLQSPTTLRTHSQSVSVPGAWHETLFGAEDPSVFNFDLASMNFGSNYGALEFGMLGKMATGAGDTPESDVATQRGSMGSQYQMPFGGISESPSFAYADGPMDWAGQMNMYAQNHSGPRPPNAFAIETNMQNFTSPEAHSNTPDNHNESPLMSLQQSAIDLTNSSAASFLSLTPAEEGELKHNRSVPPAISTPQLKAKSQLHLRPSNSKRPKDPSQIYTAVTSPYPYTSGFHSLIAYLQKRFATSPSKTLAIAKSLASIRPSFIATTKTLNREDLIFMEKCFQRTLWEYEGFIESVGTPTIVVRRTGEVAAVGKEFQILTGWRKNVLLGREPNLNVNTGHTGETPAEGSGSNTKSRGTGVNTPARRRLEDDADSNRQQPVFVAELLDDESVVSFFDDFARLAFGDSRGSVMRRGKLLKYRTKEDQLAANMIKAEQETQSRDGGRANLNSPEIRRVRDSIQRQDSFANTRPQDAKKGISGERGMQKLGQQDGMVDVTYCWTVKRDVFDIPMLIVLNFLPVI